MLKGADQAYGDNGDTKLLGHAETAILERIEVAVAGAHGFRKDDQAGAAVDGILRQTPHALQIGRPADVRDRNVAETLHEPAIGGNFEMGFQLPTTHVLRNGVVEHEGIEEVDVVDHEKRGALGIEAGTALNFHSGAGQERNAPAKIALQPIVFARIEKDAKKYEYGRDDEKVQEGDKPQ